MKFKKIPTFYQNYFRQHKISLIFFTAVLIVQSLLLVVLPLPLKEIINNLDNKPYFLKMLVCIFVLSVTSLGFSYLENIMLVKQKRQLQMMIRDYLFKKILSQTYAYHLKKQKMLMVNNLNKDVVHVEDLFTKTMVAAVRSLPSVFLLLSALVFIEPQIGLFIILLLPLYFYFGKIISKNLKKVEKSLLHREQIFEQSAFYVFESFFVAKSLLREKDFVKALSEKLMDMKKAFFKKIMITARMELAFRAIRVFIVPVVIFLGSLAIFYDKINLGELFVIASYLNAMQRPVFQISRLITKIPKGLASLGRLEELDGELNQVESFVSTQNPPILSKSIGQPLIKVEGVEHSWSEREEAFINVGRLKLESGDFVGVVGASGTGKSSFLKFLNRLIDPNKGEIFIQNILSKNIEKESLRKKIRIVLQDNFLLSSSVRENISLSGFDGDDVAVWEALSLACAKSFVESLPNGLDTRIGRGGHPLSGGQIKRINLARALYDLSEVSLIGLDEPTTGLDPENAAQLIVNLKKLSLQGKTVVWVTHNLSEVTEFDRVFSLENRFLKDIGPSV